MTQGHKIIKYCAIAFAIYLVVSIIAGIAFAVSFLFNIFGEEKNLLSEPAITIVENNINTLNIEIAASNLTIKTGEEFKVETNDSGIEVKQNDTLLEIIEKKKNIIKKNSKSKVIIYIPENISILNTNIESGAGKINIESLTTDKIEFELGAGNVAVDNLVVNDKADIQGGAGNMEISNSTLKDLELEIGVGNVELNTELLGSTNIECGVGNLELSLTGSEDDYKININKGVGNAKINGENIDNGKTFGDGENKITIEGGVGSIKVSTN